MDELLDEFFRQFDQDEQQIITSAKASADEILANGTAAAKVRAMASGSEERVDWVLQPEDDAYTDAAGVIYSAYVNVLWRKTDLANDESIQGFLAKVDKLKGPVLKRYRRQAEGWIEELRRQCRLNVSMLQSGLPQNGILKTGRTDTSHATEQTEALKSPSSAADGFAKPVPTSEILQSLETWRSRQRYQADYLSVCARRLHRDYQEFKRQEELLRDARSYGESLLMQMVSETEDVLALIKRIAMRVHDEYVPRHRYHQDFQLGYSEFESALMAEGWPSLSDRATSILQERLPTIRTELEHEEAGGSTSSEQTATERDRRLDPVTSDSAETNKAANETGQKPNDSEKARRASTRQAAVLPTLTRKRWSRSRLASEAGVGKNSINQYLDGTRVKITQANRKGIAEALELGPEQLPD